MITQKKILDENKMKLISERVKIISKIAYG